MVSVSSWFLIESERETDATFQALPVLIFFVVLAARAFPWTWHTILIIFPLGETIVSSSHVFFIYGGGVFHRRATAATRSRELEAGMNSKSNSVTFPGGAGTTTSPRTGAVVSSFTAPAAPSPTAPTSAS